MLSKKYIEFYNNYNEYIGGVKYKITTEDASHYYIGKSSVNKSQEGKTFKVGFIISDMQIDKI